MIHARMCPEEHYILVVRTVKSDSKIRIMKADEARQQIRLSMYSEIRRSEYYFDIAFSQEDNLARMTLTAVGPSWPELLTSAAGILLRGIVRFYHPNDVFRPRIER